MGDVLMRGEFLSVVEGDGVHEVADRLEATHGSHAVLAQQADVMDAIQRLRARAQANNKLTSTNEQTVIVQQVEGRQVIAIQPTDPGTDYVPYYDPGVVYGGWPYPAYPPYYFPAPGYIAAGIVATGIAFGAGYALGRWVSGRNYWGGGVNWSGNNITINNRPGNLPGNRPSNPISNVGNKWQPRVEHRQGVGNRGNRQQLDFRGRGGQKVLNPGGGRAGLGQRPAAGTGPSRGHHAAHRGGGRRGGKVATGASRGGGRVTAGGGRGGGRVTAGGGRGGGRVTTGGGRRGGKVATGASRGGGRVTAGGGRRGGAMRVGGGRGGMRARGGRGRRSDLRLKHDITLLGHLDNGLGFYRFSYNGSSKAYVGVIAQEVQQVMPQAVAHGRDGYLVVNYEKLGLKFESYKQWIDSGAQVPKTTQVPH